MISEDTKALRQDIIDLRKASEQIAKDIRESRLQDEKHDRAHTIQLKKLISTMENLTTAVSIAVLGPLTDSNGQLCPRGPLDYVLMKRLERGMDITQDEVDAVMAEKNVAADE